MQEHNSPAPLGVAFIPGNTLLLVLATAKVIVDSCKRLGFIHIPIIAYSALGRPLVV